MTPRHRQPIKTPRKGQSATSAPKARKRAALRQRPLTWADARVECVAAGWLFTLPVTERTNVMWRRAGKRTILSDKHRGDKATVALVPAFRHVTLLAGDLAVRMVWWRAQRSGDVDSRIKATLDLLQGVAYADDKQIRSLSVERRDDPTQPARIEMFVTPWFGSPL